MAAGMALMGHADPNTPVCELLATLAKRSDIETSPLDGDAAAPWLYIASRPDAPRPLTQQNKNKRRDAQLAPKEANRASSYAYSRNPPATEKTKEKNIRFS